MTIDDNKKADALGELEKVKFYIERYKNEINKDDVDQDTVDSIHIKLVELLMSARRIVLS